MANTGTSGFTKGDALGAILSGAFSRALERRKAREKEAEKIREEERRFERDQQIAQIRNNLAEGRIRLQHNLGIDAEEQREGRALEMVRSKDELLRQLDFEDLQTPRGQRDHVEYYLGPQIKAGMDTKYWVDTVRRFQEQAGQLIEQKGEIRRPEANRILFDLLKSNPMPALPTTGKGGDAKPMKWDSAILSAERTLSAGSTAEDVVIHPDWLDRNAVNRLASAIQMVGPNANVVDLADKIGFDLTNPPLSPAGETQYANALMASNDFIGHPVHGNVAAMLGLEVENVAQSVARVRARKDNFEQNVEFVNAGDGDLTEAAGLMVYSQQLATDLTQLVRSGGTGWGVNEDLNKPLPRLTASRVNAAVASVLNTMEPLIDETGAANREGMTLEDVADEFVMKYNMTQVPTALREIIALASSTTWGPGSGGLMRPTGGKPTDWGSVFGVGVDPIREKPVTPEDFGITPNNKPITFNPVGGEK